MISRFTFARADSNRFAVRGLLGRLAAALLAGVMLGPVGAFAQQQTPANEPVPAWAKASFDVYLQMKAKAHGGTKYMRADIVQMPDWSGIWTRSAGRPPEPGKQPVRLFSGDMPKYLTPRYKAAYLVKLYKVGHGDEWDQLSDCLPAGYPRFLTEPFLREFIVTPEQTWWVNEQQSEARRIYTDDRGHIPMDQGEANPLWEGDSIGFWDGDTLVVHTLYVTHGQYQRSNPEYSTETSTIERIRKIGPNAIEDDVTVWDPKSLIKPWHDVAHYTRVTTPDIRINMWSCDANNNVIRTATGGSTFILPGEVKTVQRAYREPQDFYLTDVEKTLFDTNDPITLTADMKHWLKLHLPNPEDFASLLGPVSKEEMVERGPVQKMERERQARFFRAIGAAGPQSAKK